MVNRAERKEAEEKGLSPYYIVINPERYYLGQDTQIWLYYRQCAHIQQQHSIVREDPRKPDIQDEQEADCLAIKAMESDPDIHFSKRLIDSIERDIERLIREKRWSEVLTGPQRRISLRRCASLK